MDLPFDGAISAFYENDAPDQIRNAIRRADKGDVISASYPHSERLARKVYDRAYDKLQIELVKLQSWVRDSGTRIVMVFEGRDAAGKGGTINRMRTNLNPRAARVVALSKPTETEQHDRRPHREEYTERIPNPEQCGNQHDTRDHRPQLAAVACPRCDDQDHAAPQETSQITGACDHQRAAASILT